MCGSGQACETKLADDYTRSHTRLASFTAFLEYGKETTYLKTASGMVSPLDQLKIASYRPPNLSGTGCQKLCVETSYRPIVTDI